MCVCMQGAKVNVLNCVWKPATSCGSYSPGSLVHGIPGRQDIGVDLPATLFQRGSSSSEQTSIFISCTGRQAFCSVPPKWSPDTLYLCGHNNFTQRIDPCYMLLFEREFLSPVLIPTLKCRIYRFNPGQRNQYPHILKGCCWITVKTLRILGLKREEFNQPDKAWSSYFFV